MKTHIFLILVALSLGLPTASAEESSAKETPALRVGGALRANAFVKSWEGQESNRKKFGDLDFDTFRLNADATKGKIDMSLEYRFYGGYQMLHHGYFAYHFGDDAQVQLGVHRKPFGILPYASHNWFFDMGYYLGLVDDYDAGLKLILPLGNLDLQFAFYKNDEGSFTGNSSDSARYSYDVVSVNDTELAYAGVTEARNNQETNQGNLRLTYTLEHGSKASTELGASGELGGLYNSDTESMGHHWAAAMHANGSYGPWNIMLEAIRYSFQPKNPAGQDDRFIVMGAYDAPYKVASVGTLLLANLAYTFDIQRGPLDSLTLHSDYSYLRKDDFVNSQQYVLGSLISTGRLLTYVDFAFGKNHSWLGPDYGNAFANADPDAGWHLRFNMNFGYYF